MKKAIRVAYGWVSWVFVELLERLSAGGSGVLVS